MTKNESSVFLDVSLAKRIADALIAVGVKERTVKIFMLVRGISGSAPMSLRIVSKWVSENEQGVSLTAERIRQLVSVVEKNDLPSAMETKAMRGIRADISSVIEQISTNAPASDEELSIALKRTGINVISPATVVRMADLLGCQHELRLTTWSSRAKYVVGRKDGELTEPKDASTKISVPAIVPVGSPEIFESFINLARKISRGTGVVSCRYISEAYSTESSVPVSEEEAFAYLAPFAMHLGRHNGEEWFSFFNTANDFLRKASIRVQIFEKYSFELLCDFHRRYNRSMYAKEDLAVPQSVLREALILSGFEIDGDSVTAKAAFVSHSGHGDTPTKTQMQMVRVFKECLKASNSERFVPRRDFMKAMKVAGIVEATAHLYLSTQGIFKCSNRKVQFADQIGNIEVQRSAKVTKNLTAAAVAV
jgi:hypothetical protein